MKKILNQSVKMWFLALVLLLLQTGLNFGFMQIPQHLLFQIVFFAFIINYLSLLIVSIIGLKFPTKIFFIYLFFMLAKMVLIVLSIIFVEGFKEEALLLLLNYAVFMGLVVYFLKSDLERI